MKLREIFNLTTRIIKIIIFSFLTIFFVLLISELGLRFFFYIRNFFIPPNRLFSKYLGCEVKANDRWECEFPGFGLVKYSTGPYGFRVFGDLKTRKKKILVLGDSHTQAWQVSDGETYYDYLRKNNKNIEIFAYGCGGYGSLQEYMILDKYFDLIKPDLILWQFCANDFINNYHQLESESFRDNNRMVRPYLVNGKIRLLFPAYSKGLAYVISRNSYLLNLVIVWLMKNNKKARWEEPLYNVTSPQFKKSVRVTSKIFSMVKKRVGDTPIIAFGCSGIFPGVCKKYGIYYIQSDPFDYVNYMAKTKGLKIDGMPYDGHFNKLGHLIIGKKILEYLLKKSFVKT